MLPVPIPTMPLFSKAEDRVKFRLLVIVKLPAEALVAKPARASVVPAVAL